MLRRFLDCLKERIESALGEHVDLADYIDFICCSCRSEIDFLKDGSDIIDTVVGSGVHLSYVKDGTVKDALTGGALVAGIAVYRVLTVDAPGKDLGDRGLSRTVLAAEKLGVSELLRDY